MSSLCNFSSLLMLIVLKEKQNTALIKKLQELLEKKYELKSHVIGNNHRVLAVTGDSSKVDIEYIRSIEGIRSVDRVNRPFKLASRDKKDRTLITVAIRPQRSRDRRQRDVLDRARQLLGSLKSYLVAQEQNANATVSPTSPPTQPVAGMLDLAHTTATPWMSKKD